MRFFSILLASAILMVVGCGGDDAAETPASGAASTGVDSGPAAGMDPAAMKTDPIKNDKGEIVDSGDSEEVPKGSKITPGVVTGSGKNQAPKEAPKEAPKKGDKK